MASRIPVFSCTPAACPFRTRLQSCQSRLCYTTQSIYASYQPTRRAFDDLVWCHFSQPCHHFPEHPRALYLHFLKKLVGLVFLCVSPNQMPALPGSLARILVPIHPLPLIPVSPWTCLGVLPNMDARHFVLHVAFLPPPVDPPLTLICHLVGPFFPTLSQHPYLASEDTEAPPFSLLTHLVTVNRP